MQAVIKDLTELSTSVAIASSIWLLRCKIRWSRLRLGWGQRMPAGQSAMPAVPAADVLPINPPVPAVLPAGACRPGLRLHTALDHIEVVEDAGWQLWDAAVASLDQRASGPAA